MITMPVFLLYNLEPHCLIVRTFRAQAEWKPNKNSSLGGIVPYGVHVIE